MTNDPELKRIYNKIMADYIRNKYQNDPDFRKKKLEYNRQWRKDNPDKWKRIHEASEMKRRENDQKKIQ